MMGTAACIHGFRCLHLTEIHASWLIAAPALAAARDLSPCAGCLVTTETLPISGPGPPFRPSCSVTGSTGSDRPHQSVELTLSELGQAELS